MKRMISFFLGAFVMLCFAGCHREPEVPAVSTAAVEITETTVSVPEETTIPATSGEEFSFSQLQHWDFLFSSGAGGWGTNLQIHADGSFSGDYHDSEMGLVAEEYPNGSIYLSVFTGQFSAPQKRDAYTYSLKPEFIDYENQPGTTQIRDGIQYCYSEAHGLAGTPELLLYLPGTPIENLPEDFLLWANLYGSEETELSFYGLYDPINATGFYSYHIADEIRAYIQGAEAADQARNDQFTDTDRYQLWDDALNALWAVLKEVLEESAMEQLTAEQIQWIREKEQASENVAAELTRERVYQLLAYLPQS